MKRDELYLGVDLGGVNVRAAVVDAMGHVLGQENHRLLSKEPPQVAEAVLRAGKTACGAAGIPFSEMKAMGLGVAGMIDREQGLVRSAPALGWRDVPFVKLLQARTPRTRLWISSELSVSAWGERAAGAGRGVNDLIVVLVGATIGRRAHPGQPASWDTPSSSPTAAPARAGSAVAWRPTPAASSSRPGPGTTCASPWRRRAPQANAIPRWDAACSTWWASRRR